MSSMSDESIAGHVAGVVAVFSVIVGVLPGLVHQNLSLLVVRRAASSDAAEQ